MKYIVIEQPEFDCLEYPLDTPEQVTEAQAALREAGMTYADVYVGDGPDSYKLQGIRLYAYCAVIVEKDTQ